MADPTVTEQPPNTLSVIHPAFATDEQGQPVTDPAAADFYAQTQPPGQPEPAAPTTQEGIVPPAQPPVDRLIAGKYRTVDEAERGIQELQRTLTERNQENLTLKAVNQALEPVMRAVRPEPRPETPQFIRPVLDEQGNAVIPASAIEEIVQRRANEAAAQQIQNFLGPLAAIGQAEVQLRAKYPEASAQEGDFRSWIAANPAIQSKITQDPEWNLEAAYLRYDRDRGATLRAAAAQTTSTGQAVIDTARREASAVPSAAGQRRVSETQTRDAALTKLLQHAQETGDKKPYANARMEEAIGSKFLSDMEKTSWGR
jgi:hypothetical protein